MNPARVGIIILSLFLLSGLAACGKDKFMAKCNEPEPYQSIVASKRIVVPEGLDPLDDIKEMPIPKAETPERPEGVVCLSSPPAVGSID
jgi:hypothetical protein